jgi:hypothetical protein
VSEERYQRISAGPELAATASAVTRRTRGLATERTVDKVLEVAGNAVRLAESASFRVRLNVGEPPDLACRPGCAACCRASVTVTPVEAIRLARHPNAAAARERLVAGVAAGAGQSWMERSRSGRMCAFLDGEGRCTVYDARPLTCRAWTSTDAKLCADLEHTFHGSEYDTVRFNMLWSALNGMKLGLLEAGLSKQADDALLELHAAVLLALDEDVVTRWLAGEDSFASARVPL